MSPSIEAALRTDPGRDPEKQVNEDSAIYTQTGLGLLAVVCDGMGGHVGGKEASELAVRTIVESVEAAPRGSSPPVVLKCALEEANARVWALASAGVGYRPGSTVVATLIHEAGAEIAHVGDSRIYLIHEGTIAPVTRDHSLVQEFVERGLLRPEEAVNHPEANKILRALGIAKEVNVELRREPIGYAAGDVLILCSDGLTDLVEPNELLELAGSLPPEQAAGQLVDLANARGGHDNITAMVLRLRASAVRSALAKTLPLTEALLPPTEPGDGPTCTVLAMPARIPRAPRPFSTSKKTPRPTLVVVGVLLAIAALAIVAAVVRLAG